MKIWGFPTFRRILYKKESNPNLINLYKNKGVLPPEKRRFKVFGFPTFRKGIRKFQESRERAFNRREIKQRTKDYKRALQTRHILSKAMNMRARRLYQEQKAGRMHAKLRYQTSRRGYRPYTTTYKIRKYLGI